MGEAALRRIDDIVHGVAGAMDEDALPMALFGHSMGAVVAFELARFLRQRGKRQPVHLFLSGRRGPRVIREDPPTYDAPDPEFISRLRQLEGSTPEILSNPELLEILLPILRADFEAIQTYRYRPSEPLNISITGFSGANDTDASLKDMQGWKLETTARCLFHKLPGGHFFFQTSKEFLPALSMELQNILQGLSLFGTSK